jgi:hypothetical protein
VADLAEIRWPAGPFDRLMTGAGGPRWQPGRLLYIVKGIIDGTHAIRSGMKNFRTAEVLGDVLDDVLYR